MLRLSKGVSQLTKETYEKIAKPFRKPTLRRILIFLDRAITYGSALSYLVLLVWLAVRRDGLFYPVFWVPTFFFCALTAVRALINAPRPYETLGIEPIIPKERSGKSFPSRHVGSAAVLSMAFVRVFGGVGFVFVGLSVLLALLRVIGGVHYPRDVLAAFFAGILCGALLFLF